MIPRLYYIDIRFISREYISRGSLDSFLGGDVKKEIIKYRVKFHGIVAQEEGSTYLHVIGSGEKIVLLKPTKIYCRWHSGSLIERDNPIERRYCVRESITRTGYCMEHKDSLRAVYSLCFESSGIDSLRNCWILDGRLKDKVNYTVYLLAYSSNGFKVGVTRDWRLYNRIAEQPHVVATTLYTSNSAVKARDVEIRAGRLEGLTEKPHRVLRETLNTPIFSTINRLEKIRDKVLKLLRIKESNIDNSIFRVEPGLEIEYYIRAREVDYELLFDKTLEIIDYYAGYLLLSDIDSNTYYLVKGGKILHTNSFKPL